MNPKTSLAHWLRGKAAKGSLWVLIGLAAGVGIRVAMARGEAMAATTRLFKSGDGLPNSTAGAMLAALRPADEAENKRMLESTLSLTNSWASSVPEEAARWAETLPAGPVLNSAAPTIVQNWNRYDPAAARAWAESLPDESARAAALEALGQQ